MELCEILLIILIIAVVFVNGWTDAPNAIAGAVATKAIGYRAAVSLAAVCNLAGLLVMSLLSGSVADTITGMADFGGVSPRLALAALLAAMASIVVFAASAWGFGIPTSESHALIAALTGAAVALGQTSAINISAWKKIILGLVLSLILGFLSGRFFAVVIGGRLQRMLDKWLDGFQIFSAGCMAFMHGAQDGQKFVAVFVIAEMLVKNRYSTGPVNLRGHILPLMLCALVMALGTSVGGKRIIDTLGGRMVSLKKHESVCADLGGGLFLFIASLAGLPVSTTHVKTSAIMGAVSGKKNPAVFGEMIVAWIVTFPVCGALGYAFTKFVAVVMGL